MASKRFPSLVAFKGPNNKYLGYCKNGEYRGHLKFCYDDLTSPFVKHEIVEAANGFTHIKCCYNNRYWSNRENLGWIVAGQYSPNNDLSSQSCTLFDLKPEDKASNKVSLRLLQNKYVFYKERGVDSELEGYLLTGEDELHKNGSFILYDAGSVVRLPKFVAFKGPNGKFLQDRSLLFRETILQFSSSDQGDNSVRHEVDEIGDGNVRIKHLSDNTNWLVFGSNTNWVVPGGDPSVRIGITAGTGKEADFRPIQIDSQTVALRCLINSMICRSLTTDDKLDYLSASATSLEAATFLTVVETVFSRRVHSIVYDLDSAHIYGLEPLALANGSASNMTSQSATMEIGLEYTESKSKSWSNSNSLKTGVKATFQTGIPFIASGELDVSVEDTFTWEWGEETEQSTTIPAKFIAVVEPGKTVEVVLQATRAKCDVKFSYVQEDLLTTGERVSISSEDGMFKGMNYFDIRFIANESQTMKV